MTRDEFSALAVSHLAEITGFARRLTRNPSDADDLVQDTYDRAFRHWGELREVHACRAWLFRIARNIHVDRVRSTAARPELRLVRDTDGLGPDPVVSAETVERLGARELETALQRLPDEQREAVLLGDLWGFAYDEIAQIAGCALGTVQSHIARGRAAVIAALSTEARVREKVR